MTAAGEFKKVTDPFVQSFQSLPGVATLGAAGKTLFNKGFTILKNKREQALLRERLGLTREEFGQLKKQKAVIDAQEKYAEELKGASDKLLGIDVDRFNIAAGRFTDESGAFIGGVNRLIETNQEGIDKQEARYAAEQKGAAKRVEKDNEKMRKEEETQSIFHSIAAGIDNLAAGVANIKAEDVGMGLLAPIGLIGAVIVSFVGGFVTEVKRQFDGLKALVATFGRLFKPIKDAITSAGKSMFGNTLISAFFDTIKNGFTRIGNFLGGITTFIKDSKFVSIISDGATKVRTAIRTISDPFVKIGESIGKSVTRVLAMSSEGGVISKVLGFAKGFGATLGKLFLPVTIVIGAFDAITGFIDGFKESEGNNILSRFYDGVGGGLGKLVGNLIGIPLDLLKSGVSWIMSKLGFDSAVEFLESFSFAELIKNLVSAPFNMISKAIDYIVKLFTGDANLFADIGSMFGSIADGATSLLKSILRGILPDPSGESDGVFGFIKKAVSAVIPDGVYEFAGLDPKTGEAIPEPESEQLEAATGGGSNRFDRVQSRMDRKRERLSETQDENFEVREVRRRPPPVIINQTDASQVSSNTSSSSTPAPMKDTSAPAGTVPGHPMYGYG
tara:strand:- start:846 stop:2693 length:1848 start_codon:yes stop_codon:yes gene_type:complete